MSAVEWGPAIEVAGKRPDWLRDDERVAFHDGDDWYGCDDNGASSEVLWVGRELRNEDYISRIRLPTTHPFYTVQSHNTKHGTNFIYWPGGDCAPCGVNEGDDVLLRGGAIGGGYNWTHSGGPRDIIGYTRRPASPDDTVKIKRMSVSQWVLLTRESPLSWARAVGLIIEPTQAERIAAKVGLSVEQVEAVLREVE